MELKSTTVLVVGAGLSGLACCGYLLEQGANVLLADGKSRDELGQEVQALEQRGVNLFADNYLPERPIWDLTVASPGVPPDAPQLAMSRDWNIPVIGEVELAWRVAQAPFIGITGTNGKTTTAALLDYVLRQCGRQVLLGGNIGVPLIGGSAAFSGDQIIAELSSFQLETCVDFRPLVAVHLNLTPDHLDRHGSMENYALAKERIFAKQTAADFAVLNADDPYLAALSRTLPAQLRFFSLEGPVADGAYLTADNQISFMEAGQCAYAFPAHSIYIKGRHNWANAMAAAIAAHAVGADYAAIAQALHSFPGVEHRLEFVCEKKGVIYINDSKGTNPDSTEKALLAYEQPLIILLGGYDKGADFHELMQLVKQRARLAVLYGATLPKLRQAALDTGMVFEEARDMRDAVAKAKKAAQPGEVVLFSPACASWDAFANFELRGKLFKELVK